LRRERLRIRHAAGEGDDVRIVDEARERADGRGAVVAGVGGEKAVHQRDSVSETNAARSQQLPQDVATAFAIGPAIPVDPVSASEPTATIPITNDATIVIAPMARACSRCAPNWAVTVRQAISRAAPDQAPQRT